MTSTPQLGVSRHTTDSQLGVPEVKVSLTTASTLHSQAPSRANSPTPSSRPGAVHLKSSIHAKEYFVGPRDLEKHSKLPYWLRLSGSVTPRLIVPMIFVTCWSTAITCISQFVYPLGVSDLLLTVLGFVIAMAISFRTSSAYERYSDGRKYWTQISQASRDLSRYIWGHVSERHSADPALGREDLLAKVTALNLITAFAVALKHKLRFEPYAQHEDLEHLISHLQTYAGEAMDPRMNINKHKTSWKAAGEYLDISFAQSNPRKAIKRSTKNLGHLPMEILLYLNAYIQGTREEGLLSDGPIQAMTLGCIQSLNEAMTGTERVINTPLPVAYSIAISQITWIYILVLPFQLWTSLNWVTIPGTIVGAYVILALAAIGRELENPFGDDTNDLPLDHFCQEIAREIDVVCSRPMFRMKDFVKHEKNTPMFNQPYAAWHSRTTDEIRDTLRLKATSAKLANDPIESEKHYHGTSIHSV